jgi:hypothetical protein
MPAVARWSPSRVISTRCCGRSTSVAVTVNEVNYGVSPGDSYQERPYAYVGPWSPRTGAFWNAPFGAVLPLDMTKSETVLVGVITEFFERGRAQL